MSSRSSSNSSINSADKETAEVREPVLIKRRVLVAEDNEDTGKSLKKLLELALPVVVDTVVDGNQALAALTERAYSILLTDLKMPRMSGMQLIEAVQERRLPVTVIVTTGHGSIDEAVKAMQLGAYNFLTKPPSPEHLCLIVRRALQERTLVDEVNFLREQLQSRYAFHNILTKNPKMHAVFQLIGNIGQSTATVLIEGETGTGKELAARAIHEASPKRTGPMVAINCAAVPETLLESELFGHEKGAFTGAVGQRKGRFELAHGGTLFLDEVGDVPATMQAKLLRVLQERRFERVGGAETIEVDVRVITATNRSLQNMVKDGKFREDLYYRLNVVKIDLPPLRERPEDIPLLAAHFAEKYSSAGTGPKQISPAAMDVLLSYRWPGNIRELENAIERACVTSREESIQPENLPPEIVNPARKSTPVEVDLSRPLTEQLHEVTAAFEERYLRQALTKARGHVGHAATIAGMSRRSVSDKVNLYKIDKSQLKGE
ncbi:MAG: sigma-54-dependent Fis family transcriptional regulator [Planctomycetes bacterium]|nr:sigma-54-dependent Fis family transcriptional regulator [Planctomycetota bacterium]